MVNVDVGRVQVMWPTCLEVDTKNEVIASDYRVVIVAWMCAKTIYSGIAVVNFTRFFTKLAS